LILCCSGSQQLSADNCYYNTQVDSEASSGRPLQVVTLAPQSQSVNTSVASGSRMPTQISNSASKSGLPEFDSRRVTPVLPRRMEKNRQLVEFLSNTDGSNMSSSSMSGSSSLQTPVISHSSKDSSLSDDMRNLPVGQFASSDLEVDNDTGSVKSMPGVVTQLAHCSSEKNLAASLPRHLSHHCNHAEPQHDAKTNVQHAQQLRRRSRSADNLSQRNRQKKQEAWSAVEIDIAGQHSARNGTAKLVSEKPRNKSELGQRNIEGLPAAFNAVRLRPFRQQMNSVVVSLVCLL